MKKKQFDYNILLIGFMGTGKSTVSAYLKEAFDMDVIEMDQVIAKREQMSISDIFKRKGEEYFRDLETDLLIETQAKTNTVISCGGGVPMRERNVAEMKKNGKVVLLTASAETILERVKNNHDRPLLEGNKNVEFITELMEKRREKYEAAADIIIQTDGKNKKEICDEIVAGLESINKKEELIMEQRIKGTTGLLMLIGSPVGHSGSPAMYNFSFQYHKQDYAYMAFDIKEDQVGAALDAMRLFKMRGCNVTMPCKNEAARLVDELSPAARIIGAVNTIVNENGKLVGHITDGTGFVQNLKEHGVEVKDKKMVVLGAGGAATAIQVQCALDGAASISIFNPDDPFLKRAENTAEKLKKEAPDCKVQVFCIDDQEKLREEIEKADILVNGTLAGMKPHEDTTLIQDRSMFRPELVVADVVYNPEETRLLREAKEAGCRTVGGKGMLLWQGAAAYKLYTGMDMPVEEYRKFQERNKEK